MQCAALSALHESASVEQSSVAALAYCKGLVTSLLDIIAAHNLRNKAQSVSNLPPTHPAAAVDSTKVIPGPPMNSSAEADAVTDSLQNEGLIESEASVGSQLRVSDTDVSAAGLQTEKEGAMLETVLYASILLWKMSSSEEARETVAKIAELRVDLFYGRWVSLLCA